MSQTETKSSGGNPRHLEIRGSLLAKNTVLNFVGLALPTAVGLATIPFVVRWLGTDRFGVLSLAWVVVGYFSFFDLGLGRATTKYVAEALGKGEIEKIPGYFWTTAYIQAVLGTLGAVILWLITPLLVTGDRESSIVGSSREVIRNSGTGSPTRMRRSGASNLAAVAAARESGKSLCSRS